MDFQNDFDVKAPLDEVWNTVLDVERVAPCVPGAEVLERTGDDAYKVGIRVKVGPVSMQYRGEVEIVEKDPDSHSAVMSARARETRGQGTANANVRMTLSGNGDVTHGSIATDLQLSGRAAAMGQGVIKDVSAQIIGQFAQNLAAMLGGEQAAAPEAPAAPGSAGESEPAAAIEESAPNPGPGPPPGPPPPPAAEAQTATERPGPPPPPKEEQPAAAPQKEEQPALDVLPIMRNIAAARLRDPRVIAALAVLLLLMLRRRR